MAAKKKNQPGYDIVVVTTVELLGVGLLALLAGTSPQVGTIVVIIMVGFMIGWLLIHTTELQKMVSHL